MRSQSNFVNRMREKDSLTENLAVTHSTSANNCVDMFFMAGASRSLSESQIIGIFEGARAENLVDAYKILFWARDIRGGAGERRYFRVIMDYVMENYLSEWSKLIDLVPEYGRWDDLWKNSKNELKQFSDAPRESAVMNLIGSEFSDEFENGLLAKWLPRKGKFACDLAAHLGMTPGEYRRAIVDASNTVEQKMCAKQWNEIEYQTVPSVAMSRYKKAFARQDETRFTQFIEKVKKGEANIHADAIFPHDIIKTLWVERNEAAIAQWSALPDYLPEGKSMLPVVDVSASMGWCSIGNGLYPIHVALSLGLYLSERNKSIFKDAFYTFSRQPTLQYVTGNIYNRMHSMNQASWDGNTDLEGVFVHTLKRAVESGLSEADMPDSFIILSDMEFDRCVREPDATLYEDIRHRYHKAGYKLPTVIFWNIQSRNTSNKPVAFDTKGTALVSGYSPAIVNNVLSGEWKTPYELMQEVIGGERYALVAEALQEE